MELWLLLELAAAALSYRLRTIASVHAYVGERKLQQPGLFEKSVTSALEIYDDVIFMTKTRKVNHEFITSSSYLFTKNWPVANNTGSCSIAVPSTAPHRVLQPNLHRHRRKEIIPLITTTFLLSRCVLLLLFLLMVMM